MLVNVNISQRRRCYSTSIQASAHFLFLFHLISKKDAAWSDGLTKSLAEPLVQHLQTLQYALRRVHGAVLNEEFVQI